MNSITTKMNGVLRRGALVALIATFAVLLTAAAAFSSTQAAKPKQLKIAMVVGSAANSYQAAIIAAAKKTAAKQNATVTVFDSQFDAAKAIAALEDIVSLGKSRFDGIAFLPLDNVAPLAEVKKILAAGWVIGIANGVIGPRLDTGQPQVKGLAVQATAVWKTNGVKMAKLIAMACKGINPCKVGWAGGLSQWPAEKLMLKTILTGLKASSPNVDMSVRVGDTGYTREGGLKVIGTMIQAHPDLNAIVAADQALLGAETAIKDADLLRKVKLVGWGGSIQSKPRIQDGRWFGTIAAAPVAEGTYLIKGVVQMIRTGKGLGFIDTPATLPNGGIITKANINRFTPQYSG